MTKKYEKAFVLVDYENVAIPLEKDQKKLDITKKFFEKLGKNFSNDVEVKVSYAMRNFTSETEIFGRDGYQFVISSGKKNSSDIALAVEAIDLAHKTKSENFCFVFVCGDADYIPVFSKLEYMEIPYTVYALSNTVGTDFVDYFNGSSEYGVLKYLEQEYPSQILDSVPMKQEHVVVLQQLAIAEAKAKDKNILVDFFMFRGFLTAAVREFGRKLTEKEASDLIDEVADIGYVKKDLEPSRKGYPMKVFSVNGLHIKVIGALGITSSDTKQTVANE
jgi:hypothetical protein